MMEGPTVTHTADVKCKDCKWLQSDWGSWDYCTEPSTISASSPRRSIGDYKPTPNWCPFYPAITEDWAPLLREIRAQGWAVACHNDYHQSGCQHTFWLFTKGNKNVKGEGRTDGEALSQIQEILRKLPSCPCEDCEAE